MMAQKIPENKRGEITTIALLSLAAIVAVTLFTSLGAQKKQTASTSAASCVQIENVSTNQPGNTIIAGQDFNCAVAVGSSFGQPSNIACGLVASGSWPKDICRFVSGRYGFQGYSGNTATFKCNTNCIGSADCSPDPSFPAGTYQLTGFDFSSSCGPTVAPAFGKSISVTVINSNAPTSTPAPLATSTPNPVSQCGDRCVYRQQQSDGIHCYVGNCKDPAKTCDMNNCWYNPNPSCNTGDKGREVNCVVATPPPLPVASILPAPSSFPPSAYRNGRLCPNSVYNDILNKLANGGSLTTDEKDFLSVCRNICRGPTLQNCTGNWIPSNSDTDTNLSIVSYYQLEPSYSNYQLGPTCTIKTMGCGYVTIANILAQQFGKDKYDPIKVVKDFFPNPGCLGMDINDGINILQKNGFTVENIFAYGIGGAKIPDQTMINIFRNYIKEGWKILILAQFYFPSEARPPGGWAGHFFYIWNVTDDGIIQVIDPYWGYLNPVPMNQLGFDNPPKYEYAYKFKSK